MDKLAILQAHLRQILPGATLRETTLPGTGLCLLLLDENYPRGELTPDQVRRVMDNPLYWVFCWASGQVLARMLLDQPALVRGKRVLDFGCGSGVVAITAALAGAREVIACDNDPLALAVTRHNAARNGVSLTSAEEFTRVPGHLDLIVVADVLYDRANLCWLQRFTERAEKVLIADSRVRDFDHPRYRQIDRQESCTLPDLDESPQFRDVRVYLGS